MRGTSYETIAPTITSNRACRVQDCSDSELRLIDRMYNTSDAQPLPNNSPTLRVQQCVKVAAQCASVASCQACYQGSQAPRLLNLPDSVAPTRLNNTVQACIAVDSNVGLVQTLLDWNCSVADTDSNVTTHTYPAPDTCMTQFALSCLANTTSPCRPCLERVSELNARAANGGSLPSFAAWFDALSQQCGPLMSQSGECLPALFGLIGGGGDDEGASDDYYADDGTGGADSSVLRTGWGACSLNASLFACQYETLKCQNSPVCASCLAGPATSAEVTIRYTPACKIPIASLLGACSPANQGYVQYLKCSENVDINNRVAYATAALGAVGLLGSLSVFAVILGHDKDKKSFRERILVGVFVGNLIYSAVNLVPIAVEKTGNNDCGEPTIGSAEGQAWTRGLWFWGKYTMVAYELFVIYASVVALRTGSINMPWVHERRIHAGCVAVGIAGFCGFYFPALRHYGAYLAATDYAPQQAALDSYDGLVQSVVQIWLGLLGLMLLVWTYQRLLFRELLTEIRAATDLAEEALMNSVFDGKRPAKSRELLAYRKQGFYEMARPLEAYIAVFILFGVPAAVMATGYCATSSEPSKLLVSCQHLCEMVLAMRTAATVCVYFRDPQCRTQLYDLRGLWRRLGQRRRGGSRRRCDGNQYRVGFAEENEMVLVPGRSGEGSGASDPRPVSVADSDVQMMGASSFARLIECDDEVAAAAAAEATAGPRGETVGDGIPYVRLEEA